MHSGEYVPGVSMNARIFVSELVDTLELTGRLTISVKQLWWFARPHERWTDSAMAKFAGGVRVDKKLPGDQGRKHRDRRVHIMIARRCWAGSYCLMKMWIIEMRTSIDCDWRNLKVTARLSTVLSEPPAMVPGKPSRARTC